MKALNYTLLLALTFGFSHAPALADGGNASGGGTGVVNQSGKMELLDLAEENENFEADFKKFDPRQEEAYQSEVAPRLAKIGELIPVMKGEAEKSFAEVIDGVQFYFTEKELPRTNDTCLTTKENTVQAAIQQGNKVVVSRKWYDASDAKTRGALLSHEIVMQKLGQQGYCTDAVRKAVRALMNPEKLSVKQLSDVFFESTFGKHVPKVAYEPNAAPLIEDRNVYRSHEDFTYDYVTPAKAALLDLENPKHLCYKIANSDLQKVSQDPEIQQALDQIRFETNSDMAVLSFYTNANTHNSGDEVYRKQIDWSGLALNSWNGDRNAKFYIRGFHFADKDDAKTIFGKVEGEGSRADSAKLFSKLVEQGHCNVTKEKVLKVIEAFRNKDSKKVEDVQAKPSEEKKPTDPSALEKCGQEVAKLEKLAAVMHHNTQQLPASWLQELSINLNPPTTVHFWNYWSLSGCEAKKTALEQDLARLANVRSTVEGKHGVPPSPDYRDPYDHSEAQSAE